jgi:chemotaxis protein MotB
VGHSIAGTELSAVANSHPDRVAGLIYLEAGYPYAFDNSKGPKMNEFQIAGPRPPDPSESDLASFSSLQRWDAEVFGFPRPEAELRQTWEADSAGRPRKPRNFPGAQAFAAVMTSDIAYARIPAPALVIFALPHVPENWIDKSNDPSTQQAARTYYTAIDEATERQAKALEEGVPTARVVRMRAAHYIFLSHEAETLREMRVRADQAGEESEVLRAELEELRATVDADRETIELQLAQLVSLRRDIEALQAVRDELEGEVTTLAASLEQREDIAARLREELTQTRDRSTALEARLADEQERTALAQRELEQREIRLEELLRSSADLEAQLASEQELSADALEQVRLLNQQVNALRIQLASIEQALDLERQLAEDQSATIAELSSQLNMALADRVQELSRFQSEFYSRLSRVLGDRQDVRAVGDRFVFQSEVLFPSASASIEPGGREELDALAAAMLDLIDEFPEDLPWILQVNGHTDRRPIRTAQFPSNWELSTARAIEVAKYLIDKGLPAERVAAAGFAEYQPLDDRDDEIAYRRNRRIELKLTTR